jgi:hypothetical protein
MDYFPGCGCIEQGESMPNFPLVVALFFVDGSSSPSIGVGDTALPVMGIIGFVARFHIQKYIVRDIGKDCHGTSQKGRKINRIKPGMINNSFHKFLRSQGTMMAPTLLGSRMEPIRNSLSATSLADVTQSWL